MKEEKGQRSTLNAQRSALKGQIAPVAALAGGARRFELGEEYDLEELLLRYAACVIQLVESVAYSRSGNHVAGQLLRSGTSPLPNHGEAQAAESPDDFLHKMRICL